MHTEEDHTDEWCTSSDRNNDRGQQRQSKKGTQMAKQKKKVITHCQWDECGAPLSAIKIRFGGMFCDTRCHEKGRGRAPSWDKGISTMRNNEVLMAAW